MAEWNTISSSELVETYRYDAEYWREIYIENLEIVRRTQQNDLDTSFLRKVVKKVTGSAFYPSFVGYYSNDGMPFLRVADLGNLFLKQNNLVRISPSVIKSHHQVSTISPGDIVIAKGGSIGGACIVTNDFGESAVCRDVIAVLTDPDLLDPYYLSVFLNTKFGQLQLERNKSQQVQAHLTFPAVEKLEIAFPKPEIQAEIRKIALLAYNTSNEAKAYYAQAQHLLESELGLDNLRFQKPVGYTARFSTIGLSDTFNAGRIDAQCFAPNAVFYETWLRNHARCDRLTHLLQRMTKGRQQEEATTGSTDYCSIKHISGHELTDASKCQPTGDTPLASQDDLLLAITGATIGKIGIVKRYKQLAFSGDLLCLNANSEINPHYLLAALDHSIGQVQFNRWITGSTNGHLAPRDVGKVLVPRLKIGIEARIARLVEESLRTRIESEQLLDQAKARVEQLIEEASDG